MSSSKEKLDPNELCFIPLGGSEQFGVNLNVYAYKDTYLAVDLGLGFADHRFPGIDLLLPDVAYLDDKLNKLEGLVITHAHEDHIGAVPYLWPRLQCPIYCSEFTAAVLRRKFEEAKDCKGAEIIVIKPGDEVELGEFKLGFIHVAHSIPQAVSLSIETDQGIVLHSGDWNLDPTPVLGAVSDEKAFKALGKKGVLAYIGDSTNSAVPGRAGSEAEVEEGLEAVFKECKGRIAVTTFSSNISRIISIVRAAEACGRSVCVIGRSMHNMMGAARDCGFMHDVPGFVQEEDMDRLAVDQQVYVVTGSQGEARAALARIARGDFRGVDLGRGDTVVFSAREIPGNEKDINTVKNDLIAAGVQVIDPDSTDHTIHVSGHPYMDEVVDMFGWVKPQIVVPVHGERMQLEAQARLARKCQIKNVLVPTNGSVVRLSGKPAIIDHVETGLYAVDMGKVISADHAAIRERRKLQYTGVIHASVALDDRGDLLADPQVDLLGLIDTDDKEEAALIEDLENEIADILSDMLREDRQNDHMVQEELRIGIRRYVNMVLSLKPKTTVHVMRV
ncbi:MAG: ribonuclease J [Pseudomonadota bacterium]|nr:ribonuclease J [Pseudomonadota bacterium]